MQKPFGLAVKAVIWREDGRCLLLKRAASSRHWPGAWEWPGGKADPGEDFMTALRREVGEETGLTIEPTGLAGSAECELESIRIVLLCMEARLAGGAFRLSDEHEDHRWVELADLPRMDLSAQLKDFMIAYARRKVHP